MLKIPESFEEAIMSVPTGAVNSQKGINIPKY
jgi:hypothetical protein